VYLVREGRPRPAREPAREEYYDGPVMARPADPADLEDWEYGMGKRDCEDALAAAAREGFPATRIRIPMVNGPLDYFRRIEGYLWRLVDGGPVILPDGGGHRLRHVDGSEVARFLCGILGRNETFGRAFNVAQGEAPTLGYDLRDRHDRQDLSPGAEGVRRARPRPRQDLSGRQIRQWIVFIA
jgi:nucleoside-diphosphate-sugar epimerase